MMIVCYPWVRLKSKQLNTIAHEFLRRETNHTFFLGALSNIQILTKLKFILSLTVLRELHFDIDSDSRLVGLFSFKAGQFKPNTVKKAEKV